MFNDKQEKQQHARAILGPTACRECQANARRALAGGLVGNYRCARCGLDFPLEKIRKELWYQKMRSL